MTNIGKDGAIYVSTNGADPFKKEAFFLVMIEKLKGGKTKTSNIIHGLGLQGIEPTEENINKVKAYFPADRVWED